MKFFIEDNHIKGTTNFGRLHISPDENQGYRPYELFVSSLAGCSGTLLRKILVKKRIPYQGLEMTVSATRNPNEANRIEQISIHATVFTEQNLEVEQVNKISTLVLNNCGMIQSVIESINITFQITTDKSGEHT